mmetsp:Transcript_68897/g.213108  ORF Transcript_68897/g.213108 Transcript_68897/m.213108 type:complete len:293 (-) Transcript_68897:404-1282(-)
MPLLQLIPEEHAAAQDKVCKEHDEDYEEVYDVHKCADERQLDHSQLLLAQATFEEAGRNHRGIPEQAEAVIPLERVDILRLLQHCDPRCPVGGDVQVGGQGRARQSANVFRHDGTVGEQNVPEGADGDAQEDGNPIHVIPWGGEILHASFIPHVPADTEQFLAEEVEDEDEPHDLGVVLLDSGTAAPGRLDGVHANLLLHDPVEGEGEADGQDGVDTCLCIQHQRINLQRPRGLPQPALLPQEGRGVCCVAVRPLDVKEGVECAILRLGTRGAILRGCKGAVRQVSASASNT